MLGTRSILLAITLSVLLSERSSAVEFVLPTDSQQWLNFPPISLDRLEGKGVVLYFFEESCAKCAAKWPKYMEVSHLNRLSPVVFIAVNSGNSPAQAAQYVKRHNITWPVIVDSDRSLERQFLATPISLQNPAALQIRSGKGKWEQRDPSRIEQAATAAAKEGAWRLDPNSVPLELRPAWGLVELANYSGALPLLQRAERRGSDEVKQVAGQLRGIVATQLQQEQQTIQELLEGGNEWKAYLAIASLLDAYDGFEIDEELATKLKELKASEVVKTEQVAAKKLAAAYRSASGGSPAAAKRATKMLEAIVEDYPDTEAAEKAGRLLQNAAASL